MGHPRPQTRAIDVVGRIERNIPIPPFVGGRGRPAKYPLADMQVGDSFFMPAAIKNSVAGCATSHGKRYNKKFTIRRDANGYRCWRLR